MHRRTRLLPFPPPLRIHTDKTFCRKCQLTCSASRAKLTATETDGRYSRYLFIFCYLFFFSWNTRAGPRYPPSQPAPIVRYTSKYSELNKHKTNRDSANILNNENKQKNQTPQATFIRPFPLPSSPKIPKRSQTRRRCSLSVAGMTVGGNKTPKLK